MLPYITVLVVLHLAMGLHCFQQPNSDSSNVMVPGPWNAPNFIKNWDLPGPAPPLSMIGGNNGNIDQQNNGGALDDRYLDKRQDSQQSVQFNPEGSFIDADAATVAAMQYELQSLVQTKYQAEAAIKMETGEIARTQHEAQEAERALEEATNNVRMISAHLKNAQEEASKAATRALTAQLQMSVHDQLLVTARQKLNSVTAHMIALQADLASAQQRFMLNNSTKELETRAHALNIRPDLMSMGNSESMYAGNYQPSSAQHNAAAAVALLSSPEFWRQQENRAAAEPPAAANWSPYNQIGPQDLQKSPNSPPLFMTAKKM